MEFKERRTKGTEEEIKNRIKATILQGEMLKHGEAELSDEGHVVIKSDYIIENAKEEMEEDLLQKEQEEIKRRRKEVEEREEKEFQNRMLPIRIDEMYREIDNYLSEVKKNSNTNANEGLTLEEKYNLVNGYKFEEVSFGPENADKVAYSLVDDFLSCLEEKEINSYSARMPDKDEVGVLIRDRLKYVLEKSYPGTEMIVEDNKNIVDIKEDKDMEVKIAGKTVFNLHTDFGKISIRDLGEACDNLAMVVRIFLEHNAKLGKKKQTEE